MGKILEPVDKIVGIELRRESVVLTNLDDNDEHLFATGDGCVEVSKEYLRKLVKHFTYPSNREHLEE